MSVNDKFMPIGVSLKDRACLVVGGDLAALRRSRKLVGIRCRDHRDCFERSREIGVSREAGERITLEKREYQSSEAAAYGLVVSAAEDVAVNTQVHGDASEAGVLVNVVGDLAHCNFIFPEVLRRDCLTAAISTDGKASFVSGHLRVVLDNIFPAHWERLMSLAASFQSGVESRWANDPAAKNACYSEFLEADWKKMLEELSDEQIEKELTRMLEMPE